MPWWKLKYLNSGNMYNSEQLPFGLLPGIQEVNIQTGHKFDRSDMVFKIAGRIRLEVHTCSIWLDGQVVAHVEDVDRIILRRRNFRPMKGNPFVHYHAGLVSSDGTGWIIRLTESGDAFVEKCVVSVSVNE